VHEGGSLIKLVRKAYCRMDLMASNVRDDWRVPHTLEIIPIQEGQARMYNCLWCNNQSFICRSCDRGNVYCSTCTPIVRGERRRITARRYQASRQGRLKYAERHRRYRERLRIKVTRHSFKPPIEPVIILKSENPPKLLRIFPDQHPSKGIICHCCGAQCSNFIRQYSLRFLSNRNRSAVKRQIALMLIE
jgi:hypothetical protein